ncbi:MULTISPECIES: AMP-dependent synthetase/ligase [Sphingobacterium]|uniref:Long-chain-fatty-acid--CoA ligase FadD15 n=2 Tax=Sphingobacterium TaxID=28453 RepID=A0A2X2J094_SPHMU|nr:MULTISPECIES: long-chain fatty acid--CoA ligase [Sphingobacterium]HCX56905.1 long-chain fatty acid--CoA ligase [Sphingobacterium sp.]QQT44799.1 long-chain fatty acid--CoA ligase [Sphingobacterium multivorum]QQT62473.1 long-chain fatty acid--CoA ligase [Sphingobacterium multivorum]QRQ59634.1 long-chain fatty acid--CoA ligase [Sphingobacterium multivorum]SPZ84933.1 Long-chain-fatty-acid--CoA ligase FadD15 [Sphingobacterium multivorum]
MPIVATRLFDLAYLQYNIAPDFPMFSFKKGNEWVKVSNTYFIEQVNETSKGLIALGVQPGEKVALISENRIEWNILDFAIQQIGAVVVAIYPNISTLDYTYIFNHAEIRKCIVSSKTLYTKILTIQDDCPQLNAIYSLDKEDGLNHWHDFVSKGEIITDETLNQLRDGIKTDTLASIIYTSGTTGNPKGVMLSHKNLLADTLSSEYSFPVERGDRALSFLPVCHAYERVFQYVYMYKGLTIFFAQSMDTIGEDFKSVKPHIFSAVPRVLEKVYEKIMATGEQLTGVKRKLFFWSLSIGEQYKLEGRTWWYDLQLNIARKLVFSKWREALGGDIKGIASGSAALQERLIRLYMAAGIPIYEGYGLTEAGPCIAVNCYKRGMKIGTVGLPLIHIEIKLADDGEILTKGENNMIGYYKNPEATAEAIKDGWLYTGDIGQWVDGKFLKIIDRKKEMFKTSGGKYIVPQQIESKLVESSFIEQAMVLGEGRKFPAALIVPNYNNLLEWSRSAFPALANLSRLDFLNSPELKQKMRSELNRINQNFGSWEQIKKFIIVPDEMTVETGELTPTLKMKRKVILQKYEQEIEDIYQN